jgi:hypothetical protein
LDAKFSRTCLSRCRGRLDAQRTLGGQRPDEVDGVLDDLKETYRLRRQRQVAALDAGEVQHLIDEAKQMLPGPQDVVDALGLLLGQVVELEQLPEPEDRVERGTQLVAHAGQELALGGVRPVGLPLGFQRRLGGRPLIGLQPRVDQRHAGLLGERLQHEPLLGRRLGRRGHHQEAGVPGRAPHRVCPDPARRHRRRGDRAAVPAEPLERAGDLAQRGGRPAGQLDADQLAARQRGDGGARQVDDPQLVAAVAHQLGQREQALQAGQLRAETPELVGHVRGQLSRCRRNSSGWM